MYIWTRERLGQAVTSGFAAAPVITVPTDIIRPADARLTTFDKNSAKVKDFHAPEIDRVADKVVASWRTGQPIFTIYVKGHASPEGPAQYNTGLGNHRALGVRKALQRALERKQKNLSYKVLILVQSKGAQEPIAANTTEEGRSQNRRVEIFLSTKKLLPLPKPPVEPIVKIEEPLVVTPMPKPAPEPKCQRNEFFARKEKCKSDYARCKYYCLGRVLAPYGPSAAGCAYAFTRGLGAGLLCLARLGLRVGKEAFDQCGKECDPRYVSCIQEAKQKTHCML
jgi:outer membrane protein OmpA-like peptidoglycan-associated protein